MDKDTKQNIEEAEKEYGVDQISSLEGLDAIRVRPGMYIGSTSQRGINQLIWEVLDNSIDEFVSGFGKEIDICINKDCSVQIEDHGRGIPVGPHSTWKNDDGTPMDTLTGILTKIHAGGKFNNGGYKCFKKGSKVNTENGLISIENITKDNKVINAYNKKDKVLNKFEYDYNGEINKITLENGKQIEAINGHYILIERNKKLYWEKIENIISTDLLVELESDDNIEELKEKIPKYNIVKY